MKKQLLRFRWLIYFLLIAFFGILYIKKNIAEAQYQKELIAYLELEGVFIEVEPPKWTAKFPKWTQSYFENFISVSLSYDLEDCLIGDDLKRLNKTLLRLIAEFDVVHSLQISASKSNSELVEDFFVELLSNVQAPAEVKQLDIYSPFLSIKVLSFFTEFTNLESIYVAATSIPNESILYFPINENLHTFFCKNDGRYTVKEFQHVLQSKKLVELGFENYGVDQSDTDLTPYLKDLKDLKFVKLTGNYSEFNADSLPSLSTVGFYSYVIFNDNILKALHDSKATFHHKGYGYGVLIGSQVTNSGLSYIPNSFELTVENPSLDLTLINWEELNKLDKLILPVGTNLKPLMPHLAMLKNLKFFSCPELELNGKEFTQFDDLLVNLHYAFLSRHEKPFTRKKISHADRTLKKIFFEVNELTVKDVKSLNEFKDLESLKLKCCSGLENLNALAVEKLSKLEVEHSNSPKNPLTTVSTNLKYLKMTSHKKLSLEELIDVDSFSQLQFLDLSFPKLFTIDLSGCDQLSSLKSLKFSGMCRLESGAFENMEVIDFDILPDSEKFWKDLGRVDSLKSVNGQFIGSDKAFVNLAPAAEKFTELNLRYANIRKNESLELIKNFKNTEVLHLPPEEMRADQAFSLFKSLENLKKVYLRIGLSERDLEMKYPEIEFLR